MPLLQTLLSGLGGWAEGASGQMSLAHILLNAVLPLAVAYVIFRWVQYWATYGHLHKLPKAAPGYWLPYIYETNKRGFSQKLRDNVLIGCVLFLSLAERECVCE